MFQKKGLFLLTYLFVAGTIERLIFSSTILSSLAVYARKVKSILVYNVAQRKI